MENFGRYRILERLGADALGELLRARDTRVGRTVALRIISPIVVGGPGRRDALMADASAARALSHPHVAALFDAGEEDGRVFLAHEYVTGRSLRGNVMGKPLSASRTIEFAIQIADGVAEGHRLGLVHAGLDPSTVFITDKDKAKIVDFGLAAWTSAGLRRRAVTEQLAGGKAISARGAGDVARWMSPEQILWGRADARSDVFSLGAIVYQMATGRNPFAGVDAEEAAMNVLRLAPPPASSIDLAVPEKLDAILARAMAKSPDARYPSAAVMVADLRALDGCKPAAFSPRFR